MLNTKIIDGETARPPGGSARPNGDKVDHPRKKEKFGIDRHDLGYMGVNNGGSVAWTPNIDEVREATHDNNELMRRWTSRR